MAQQRPDWRLPGDTRNASRWLRSGVRTPPNGPDQEPDEAARIAEWVEEARAQKNKPPVEAHVRKPLFRPRDQAYSRGDKALFASSVVLSAVCAFFPWYVFLNQDKFGVPTVRLGDIPAARPASETGLRADRVVAPEPEDDVTSRQAALDMFATGTLPDKNEQDALAAEKSRQQQEQPFPQFDIPFSLVHVANGRAMFEDESGLFVVQRNSVLPDSSRVSSIEKRNGQWVVVTSDGRVIEMTR